MNQQTTDKQNEIMIAWQWILDNWNCQQWNRIPSNVQKVLNLDTRLGICGGMLISQNAARGINEFILRMNRTRG